MAVSLLDGSRGIDVKANSLLIRGRLDESHRQVSNREANWAQGADDLNVVGSTSKLAGESIGEILVLKVFGTVARVASAGRATSNTLGVDNNSIDSNVDKR